MKIPKSIDILGNSIPVKIIKDLKDDRGERVDGLYSPKKMVIYLDHGLGYKLKMHTFFHEYFHALCDCLGIPNCNFSHDLEEILADNLGKQLSKLGKFTFRK